MSIFDKLFGKKNNTEHTAENKSEEEQFEKSVERPAMVDMDINNKVEDIEAPFREHIVGQPFTFMIETARKLSDSDVEVRGTVHGEIVKGQKVRLCVPNHTEGCEIVYIETSTGVTVHRAKDEFATIQISGLKDLQYASRFAIVTNIPVFTPNDLSKPCENAFLKGLIQEFPKNYQDPQYANLLTFTICHSPFIVPFMANKEPELVQNPDTGETMEKWPEDIQISFNWLMREDIPVFQLYTDFRSLLHEPNIKASGRRPRVQLMSFNDAIAINEQMYAASTQNGKEKKPLPSIVINPFDQVFVELNADNIHAIVTSEGYQHEFGKKDEETTSK